MFETVALWVATAMLNVVGHIPAKDNTVYFICRLMGLIYGTVLLFEVGSVGIVMAGIFVAAKLYLMVYRHAGVQLI